MMPQVKHKSSKSEFKRLLTAKEASAYISHSRSHIYKLLQSKEIKSFKIGKRRLFDIQDLDLYIEGLKNDKTIYGYN